MLSIYDPTGTLPDGAYDVRGWPARALLDDAPVGTVTDVLADDTGEARYLAIMLGDTADPRGRGVEPLLLPIGAASAHRHNTVVWLPGLSAEAVRALPRPPVASLDRSRELELFAALVAATSGEPPTRAGALLEADEGAREDEELAGLAELDQLRIAEGETDPRDWDVVGTDGTPAGVVVDLIVDRGALRVRYLVCETGGGDRRRVLLPVGLVRLDRSAEVVAVRALTGGEVGGLPAYDGTAITRELERRVLVPFAEARRERLYGDARYDAGAFFGPSG